MGGWGERVVVGAGAMPFSGVPVAGCLCPVFGAEVGLQRTDLRSMLSPEAGLARRVANAGVIVSMWPRVGD